MNLSYWHCHLAIFLSPFTLKICVIDFPYSIEWGGQKLMHRIDNNLYDPDN